MTDTRTGKRADGADGREVIGMNNSDKYLMARIMRGAFHNALPGSVLSIVPISGLGMVNRVFRVTCSNVELILRMRESTEALQEFCKEAWCMREAKRIGIPSPEALAAGLEGETAYLIETSISGTNGSLLPALRTPLWEALGRMARLIERFPATGFGLEFDADAEQDSSIASNSDSGSISCLNPIPGRGRFRNSFTPTWDAHIRYNLDALCDGDRLLGLGVYLPHQAESIRDAFSCLLAGFETGRLRLGLLHGDLSPRNVMVGTDETIHLIDWGCALVHAVPHYGLACLLRSRLEDGSVSETDEASFRAGYGLDVDAYEAMVRDIQCIALLDAFDKLRWALDRSPGDVPAFRRFATRMAASACHK